MIILPAYISSFTDFHIAVNINNFRYSHRGLALIYGIYCENDNMIYIGSTWDSVRRFRQHLITGHSSNPALQAAIAQHGLSNFDIYIFTYAYLDPSISKVMRKNQLHAIEQTYIDMFETRQLYNAINSKSV